MVSQNRCARNEKSLYFDMFKAIDQIESSHESDSFFSKRPVFLHARATCCELPPDTITMELDSNFEFPLRAPAAATIIDFAFHCSCSFLVVHHDTLSCWYTAWVILHCSDSIVLSLYWAQIYVTIIEDFVFSCSCSFLSVYNYTLTFLWVYCIGHIILQ